MRKWTGKRLLKTSVFCFGAMAASFLLMAPWSRAWDERQGIAIFAAVLFWASLFAGVALQIVISRRCAGIFRQDTEKNGRKRPVGLFRFFSNRAGTIADIGMLAGILGFCLSLWLTNGIGKICYVFLFVMVFFFTAHCIFNGRNYYYITHTESKKRKPGRYAAR